MRLHNTKQWLYLLFFCGAISACGVPLSDERPVVSVTPPLTGQVIVAEVAGDISEIATYNATDAGPVAALAFTPDIQTLLVAYAGEGVLRHWRLADGQLTQTLNVYPIGLGGASFDEAATMLATSAGAEWSKHLWDDDYSGWQVWDVNVGSRIKEMRFPYDTALLRNLTSDILLTHDGRYALRITVSADEGQHSLKDLDIDGVTIKQTKAGEFNFSREPEEDDFDVIAFDSTSEYFVAADEAGKVAIYAFRPSLAPEPEHAAFIIEAPGEKLGPQPLALAFDPRRKWLAMVRGTEIILWDLQAFGYPRQIENVVGAKTGITASLAFSPSSALLGVGTANGWQLWNVDEGKLILEQTGVEVYALTFSPDGRLFAWGDAFGVVHIWGIPDK